jgi:hypothetical protein
MDTSLEKIPVVVADAVLQGVCGFPPCEMMVFCW